MSIIMQINPFDFFVDQDGDALDAGYIWIGEVNKDPRQYPAIAYYDAALTIPAAMPIRTSNGYIVRNGTPTFLYIDGNYSVLVQDSVQRQVYYVGDFLLIGTGSAVSVSDLAAPDGASMVGYRERTLYDRASEILFPGDFPNIYDWAAAGGNLGIGEGTYVIDRQLDFPFGVVLHTFGNVTIDASAAPSAATFPDAVAVQFGGGSFTAIPNLSASPAIGANLLTFASAHGLVEGDIFVIFNPTDFSYSSFRDYYRAGEFCRVARVVNSTQVRTSSQLFAGYTAASVAIYKMNTGSCSIKGSLKVIAPELFNTVGAVRGRHLSDSDFTGLNAYSKSSIFAIEFDKCFNVTGDAIVGEQGALSGTGNDYGIIFSNCQHMRIDGYFTASRHGVVTGGYANIGSVPCRDIHVSGFGSTTALDGTHAVNTHGNTEHFSFIGTIMGGFDGGGNFITLKGEVHATGDGVAIHHAEMTGYSRDYSGVVVYANNNPALNSRGVIDCGGNNVTNDAADTVGGVFDCSGIVVNAPTAASIFKIIKRNSVATNIRVKLNGAHVASAAAGYESVRVSNSGGGVISRCDMTGFDAPGEASQVHTSSELVGVKYSGFVDIPVTTAIFSANAVVTFPTGIFKDVPIVTIGWNTTYLGATRVIANSLGPSVGAVTMVVATTGANFGANGTVRVYYSAQTNR